MNKSWVQFEHSFISPTLTALKRSLHNNKTIYFEATEINLRLKIRITKLKMTSAHMFDIYGVEVESGNRIKGFVEYHRNGSGGIAYVSILK